MEVTHRKHKGACIVSVSGELVLDAVNDVKEYILPLIDQPQLKGLVINFEYVNFIDSAGIGLIVSLYKTLQKDERKLALSSLSEKNKEIFNITRLDKILAIYVTEAEAIDWINA